MLWLVLVIVVLCLLATSETLRGLVAIVLGLGLSLLAIAAVLGVVFVMWDANARAKDDAVSKSRIPFSHVELVDLRMETDRPFAALTGRVRNRNPQFALTKVALHIRVQECPALNQCETVGDATQQVILDVPPGQAREIDTHVSFVGIGQPRAPRSWQYEIVSTSGR